ncbi:TlpA family protein disulfide reductase [Bradyrhizobium zhanjiangense]|uniref:TlpA family protein disulfide reductase n=1 Tax=Bradyrhizobium zhanjiangense TaxID=1325107 RepID=A0A4Q0QVP6_9BRAD|nr:TlpA disulfide reductase family protein [Bradyrhizobium zhanjiangense]RXH00936.1 TlpA family protein disulfide reductase [Bradyrhizobium zhanjiangense]
MMLVPCIGRIQSAITVAIALAAATQLAVAQEPAKKVVLHNSPRPVAAVQFSDEEGRPRSLADFKGKVVVLNLWATWCVPCRKEMPALDRLQAALGGAELEVVPLSVDRGGHEAVRKFYSEVTIRNLAVYTDPSGQALHAVGAIGLPTTLIIDRAGQEVGRALGPAEWDSPEIADTLRAVMTNTGDRFAQRQDPDRLHTSLGLLRRVFDWLMSPINEVILDRETADDSSDENKSR